jgi:RNA polymerase sigma-70 factor (ECF subfamily)
MADRPHRALADAGSFSSFYEENAPDLLVFFTRRVLEVDAALDLTAETFAQAFLHRHRFRGASAEDARAWLYGIARHQLSRFHRRGRAERRAIERLGIEVPSLEPDEQARVEELAGLAELRELVRAALAGVTETQREAIRLRVVEERPYPEVARALGISEPTARARVSRGLRGVAAALEAEGVAGEEMA